MNRRAFLFACAARRLRLLISAGLLSLLAVSAGAQSTPPTDLFVALPNLNAVQAFNPQTGASINQIGVGAWPQTLVTSQDGSVVVVQNYSANSISLIDVNSLTVYATIAGVTAIAPMIDSQYLYAIASGQVAAIDIQKARTDPTHAVVKLATPPEPSGYPIQFLGIGIAPNGRTLYATGSVYRTGYKVYAYNSGFATAGNGAFRDSFLVTVAPWMVRFSAASTRAYISDGQYNVMVVDTSADAVLSTVTFGSSIIDIRSRLDASSTLILSQYNSANPGYIWKADPTTLAITSTITIPSGNNIRGFDLAQDNLTAYLVQGFEIDRIHLDTGLRDADIAGFVYAPISIAISGPKTNWVPDTTPPSVTAISPSSGAINVPASSGISLTFSKSVSAASVTNAFSISPQVPGAFTFTSNSALFTPSSPLPYLTQFTVAVSTALADTIGIHSTWTFTSAFTVIRDTTPPVVSATFPANGAIEVPVSAPIRVVFNKAMDVNSLTQAFSINPAAPGALSVTGSTLTFTPVALSSGALYSVVIATTAKDTFGNSLQNRLQFGFQATQTPRVVGTNPANGSIRTTLSNAIQIFFNEPMNTTSLSAAFSIQPAVAGTLSFGATSMLFTPTSPLTAPGSYTVTLNSLATDLAGDPLPTPLVFSFSTLAPPVSYIFVADSQANLVHVIDPDIDAVVQDIPVDGGIGELAATNDGKLVFAGSGNLNVTDVIDAASLTVVSSVPVAGPALAVSADRKYLYSALQVVSVIDVSKALSDPAHALLVRNALPDSSYIAVGLGITPDGKKLYVSGQNIFDNTTQRIFVFDATQYPTVGNASLLATIQSSIPYGSHYVRFSVDSSVAYVGRDSYYDVIATSANVIAHPSVHPSITSGGLRVRPDGKFVYGGGYQYGGDQNAAGKAAEFNPSDLSLSRYLSLTAARAGFFTTGLDFGFDSGAVYLAGNDSSFSGVLKVALGTGQVTQIAIPGQLYPYVSFGQAIGNYQNKAGHPTPPPAIALVVAPGGVGVNSVNLSWTAVGDNGYVGRDASYDLRYATFPIVSDASFYAATPASLPAPKTVGSAESYTLAGLVSDTTYFVAIRAIDFVGNIGPMSNTVTVETVASAPPSTISDLAAPAVFATSATLTWTAPGGDGARGQAFRYEVRYSTVDGNGSFVLAGSTLAAGAPTPSPAGAHESFTVTGLTGDVLYFFAVRAINDFGMVGSFSNVVSTATTSNAPPATIVDLTASAPSQTAAVVSWTAPGAHGSTGTAAAYDLRWAPTPIVDDASFLSATQVPGLAAPRAAGSLESLLVTGLPFSSTVYFAIKTTNAAGVTSALSNGAAIVTTGDPAFAAFAGIPQIVVSGQSAPIGVVVTDASGHGISRVNVTFAVISGAGTINPASTQTADAGTASVTFTAPGGNEVDTIKADVQGFQSLQTNIPVIVESLASIEGFPTTPVVLTAGETTVSTSSLGLQWISTDPSGIADNFLMIGAQGDMALGDWVATASPGSAQGNIPPTLLSLGGYLYAFGIGGNPQSAAYSQVQTDGSLGAWTTISQPASVIISGFVYGGTLYLMDINGAAYKATVSGGQVTAWTQVGGNVFSNRPGFDASVVGNVVYAIGGYNTGVSQSSTVYIAQIQADGSIPSWKQTTPLPAMYSYDRAAPRLVSLGNYIYVIGGTVSRTVYFAKPNADGTIPAAGQPGSWTATTPLLETNDGLTALPFNNAIYLVGGSNGDANSGFSGRFRTFRAVPNADGTIPAAGAPGYWKLVTPLPAPMIGRAAVANNRLYMYDQGGTVRFAELLSNGYFGSWTSLPNPTPNPPVGTTLAAPQRHGFAWTSLPVAGGNDVYIVGGALPGDTAATTDVFFSFLPAPFNFAPGNVSSIVWERATALPQPLRNAAAVTDGSYVYVLGGRNAYGYQNTIYAIATGPTTNGQNNNPWRSAGQLPEAYAYLVATVLNNHVYITGVGLGAAEVWGAPITAPGTIGAFVKMAGLPTGGGSTLASTGVTLFGYRGRLYVSNAGTMYSAAPDSNGMVTQWRNETSFDVGFKFGLQGSNQTLYAIGGAGEVNALGVYAAAIGADGVLGRWTLIGHQTNVRNTGVAVLNDNLMMTFGPRMDPANGQTQLEAETGTFYDDTLVASVHLSGNDIYNQSVGTASNLFATNLSLLRGQTYYASVRTTNTNGVRSRVGNSGGVLVLPISTVADVLPPRTTLHVGLPSAGTNPTFIHPTTPLSFTSVDDRATVGDGAGDGVNYVTALLDGVVISTDPAAVLTISTQGAHVFSFFGSDVDGNVEVQQQVGLIVDATPPATQITNPHLFDVVAGTCALVQGAAADNYSFIDRVLVSTNNDVSFTTASILAVNQGIAAWQACAPMPLNTSTVTITAHAIDVVGNYDQVGSSVPVLVFNSVISTMAIAASQKVINPGSFASITAFVGTQLGGPLQGAQVSFSAVIQDAITSTNTAPAIPLPSVAFRPSVAVTDANGVAVTTLAIGGFDSQFTALVDQYAASEVCIQGAALVGLTAGGCPTGVYTTSTMVSYMLNTGISNGTITSQSQLDSVESQITTIAQQQFQAASSAIFDKSVGLITVTAQVVPTRTPPFVSSASIQARFVSLPYTLDLTGMPANDTGEVLHPLDYGDANTAPPFPLPGQTEPGVTHPVANSNAVAIAALRSSGLSAGGMRPAGLFGGGDWGLPDPCSLVPSVCRAINGAEHYIDPSRWLSQADQDKLFDAANYLDNYLINSTPGAKLALFGSGYLMDLIMGNHDAGNLIAQQFGDNIGVSLADLASLGVLPPALTQLIPPGLSVGLDISGGLTGKPVFGVSAGVNAGGLNVSYNNGNFSGSYDGLNASYNSKNGNFNVSDQIDALQLDFSKGGFSSSINLGDVFADQPLGEWAQQYGLKGLSVGLISGNYTGRLQVDIEKVKPDFDPKTFIKAVGSDVDVSQFSFGGFGGLGGGFGNLFGNLPSWSGGVGLNFRNTGLSFGSGLLSGLHFGSISLPKPPNLGIGSKPPAPPAFVPDPDYFAECLECSAAQGANEAFAMSQNLLPQADMLQSASIDNGLFNGVNSLAPVLPHPANVATGNVLYNVQDALVPGRPLFIQFVRLYNSLDFGSGPLGSGWSFNYGMSVSTFGQAGVMAVKLGDGSRRVFLPNADGTYRAPYGTFSTLSKSGDGTFTLTQKYGTKYHFNLAGQLDLITDKNGNTIRLSYASAGLASITDANGKSLAFTHDAAGRILTMTDPSGKVTNYSYNAAGDLVGVGAPGYSATYGYDGEHGLVSYQDARSQTGFSSGGFSYNEFHQLATETDGLGNAVASLSYALNANNGLQTTVADANNNKTVDSFDPAGVWVSHTDPLGGVAQLQFNSAGLLTKLTEADGSVTQLAYDAKGNKTAVTDPTGAQFQYVYDGNNNLTAATLPNGAQMTRTYDGAGNLASVTDAEGNVSRFAYNSSGKLVGYTDPTNRSTTLGYDASGNLASVTRPDGSKVAMTYDSLGHVTARTDENGNTTAFAWTPAGYLTTLTYPDGGTYSLTYDANGKLASETDQLGRTTRYVNDARGFVTQITNAAGGVAKFDYDKMGRVVSGTDASGNTYTTQYDAAGHIIQQNDANGASYKFTRDAVGRPTAITDPTGATVSLSYDKRGRPVTIASPEGAAHNLTYDSMGNLVSQTDPNGGVTNYTFDRTGQIVKLTDAAGHATSFHYDAFGRADSLTNANGNNLAFTYNANGFLASQTDGGGRKTQLAVDSLGQITSITDPLNRTTNFTYRWNGAPTSVTRPDGGTARFDYNTGGQLTTITDANGNATHYEHSALGAVSKVTDAAGNVTSYAYDANGRPTSITYPDGSSYQIGYDAVGRVTSFIDPMGKTHSYTFDLAGQLVSEKDLNGNLWSYAYSPDGNLTTITDPLGDVGKWTYDKNGNVLTQTNPNGGVTSFVYDAVNKLTQGTDPAGGVTKFTHDGVGNVLTKTDANGHTTTFVYNGSNDVTSITDAAGGVRKYDYDAAGQMTAITDQLGGVVKFTYDLVGRLATKTDTLGAVTALTYDPVGNRLSIRDPLGRTMTRVYDSLNRLISVTDPTGTRKLAYDALGRRVSDTDPAGNVTQFSYFANGQKKMRKDATGGITSLEYDGNGNKTAAVDASGNRTTYEYDAVNRLIRIVRPNGGVVSYTYDANGNKIRFVDATGAATVYRYDALNRVIAQTDATGNATGLAYDAVGNQTSETDPGGKLSTFAYDVLNRMTKAVDEVGASILYTYDALGRLLTTTDPMGAVITNSYDAAGRLTATTDPLGNTMRFTYDANGNLLTTTDALGHATAKTVDASGRVTATTDALNRTTRYAYDSAGNRASVTDAAGNVTQYQYDASNRLIAVIDPLQEKTVIAYDATGNKVSETDPAGLITKYEYDGNNRLTAIVDSLGNRKAFSYDASGRKVSETAADGGTTQFQYDASGRLTAAIDALGDKILRSYDNRGNLASVTDANGNSTVYGYDDAGRLVQVTDAAGGIWKYSYDAAGRLLKIIDANSHDTASFAYDVDGRLTSQTDALGNATQFQYDAIGERTKLVKADGSALSYVYDAGSRITTIQDQAGTTLATLSWDSLDRMTALASPDVNANYSYDAVGRMTQLSYPALGQTLALTYSPNGLRTAMKLGAEQTSYVYDAGRRLTSLTAPVGRGGQGTTQGSYTMTYDAVGHLLTRAYPNGVMSTYSYDLAGRLLKIAHRKGDGSLLNSFAYQYDAAGNRTNVTDNLGKHAYGYDKLNRLISVAEPFGLAQVYAYDAVGNRTLLTRVRKNPISPLPAGQPATVTETINYTYDLADKLLAAGATTYISDGVGRLTQISGPQGDVTSFAYEAFDRPKQITLPASKNLPPSLYAYAPQLPDLRFMPAPLGLRVKKTDSKGVTQYLMDNTGNVTAELDQAGAVRRKYTQTISLDDPLAVTDEYGHTEYMLKDGLGSISMLVDERGDPAQTYTYDAFGMPNTTAADKNALKFTAKIFDADARVQSNGARLYSPELGRWTTADPKASATSLDYYDPSALMTPQNLDRYAYVSNKPTSETDPFGLFVTGTFDPNAGVVTVTDDDTGEQAQASAFSGGVAIGPDQFTTNPSLGAVPSNAAPAGQYAITRDPNPAGHSRYTIRTRNGDIVLDVKGWFGVIANKGERFIDYGYRFHYGYFSEGCLTVNMYQPDSLAKWLAIYRLVSGTQEQDQIRYFQASGASFQIRRFGTMTILPKVAAQ